jgi:hypothetical protein
MPMYVLEKNKSLFLKTKNPLYAWKFIETISVLNRSMQQPIPFPDEIIDYLFETAQNILSVAHKPLKPVQRPIALAKALGLHKTGAGQGSVFNDFSRKYTDREIALFTAKKIEFYGPGKSDYAFDDIAKEYELSKATVRRIYIKHLEQWSLKAKQLLESGLVTYGEDGHPKIMTFGTAADLRESAEILKAIDPKTSSD